MSRNKENIPVVPTQRSNDALLSSSRQLPSDEFFTDSLLDVTRTSSQIPSPAPRKQSLTKARRARNSKNTRSTQQPSHRASASEIIPVRSRNKSFQPSTPLRNRNTNGHSRVRANSVTTPPGSQEIASVPSPYSGISSPPSQDLTDAYRQIEDEEDLAQTERELSDDSSLSEADEARIPRPSHRSSSKSPSKPSLLFAFPSRASTPTRSANDTLRENKGMDRTDSLSEASGLSFLKEMTDQGLAAKLTPHVSESARDRARLKEVWSHRKPAVLSQGHLPHLYDRDTRSPSSIPVARGPVLSKASRPSLTSFYTKLNGDRDSDTEGRLSSNHSSAGTRGATGESQRGTEKLLKPLPTNTRIDRQFNFSKNFGFPSHRVALTEKNLEQQNRGGPKPEDSLPSRSSAASLHSDQSSNYAKPLHKVGDSGSKHTSRLPHYRRPTKAEHTVKEGDSSQIDWVATAADVPLPSVETTPEPEPQESTPTSLTRRISPEKSRRGDNDFTGQSFQVSESPPVRQRNNPQEQILDKEIEGIAKKAVATSRLSEIRERQSQENLRSTSKSPAPRSASRSSEQRSGLSSLSSTNQDYARTNGEHGSDAPVVVFRSTSNGSVENPVVTLGGDRPSLTDRKTSHDHLQRLARAMSSSARSSSNSQSNAGTSKDPQSTELEAEAKTDERKIVSLETKEVDTISITLKASPDPISQTPKVVGAWTDTILPDTIKTIKQKSEHADYAPTPHISTGGWVDTPVPIAQRKLSGSIHTIDEVPEELTAGIVKDSTSSDTIKVEVPVDSKVLVEVRPEAQPPAQTSEQPKSALASILEQQKLRLTLREMVPDSRDDTLNLGHDTIESLQDLLKLDENDLTTLSRLSLVEDDTRPLGEAQAEADLLERLGVKLDRLRHNIQDARKGISKLEHQVLQPMGQALVTSPQELLNDTVCQVCNVQTFQPHFHGPMSTSKLFPSSFITLSLPIPLLFQPRKANQRIPRPTAIGYITLAVWLWYVVEITMCEIYCRPKYTDFYVWPSEPEPEFPFVLPTMLMRWSRVINLPTLLIPIIWLLKILGTFVRALWRMLAMSAGWTDGFARDTLMSSGQKTDSVVKMVIDTATQVASAVASSTDASMNDDEYI